MVTEEKAPDGYVMDVNGKSQTVTVNPNDTQTLQFFNEPLCSLTIKKVDSVRGKPVPNTEFTVKDGNGAIIGKYVTGKDGTVTVKVSTLKAHFRQGYLPRGAIMPFAAF